MERFEWDDANTRHLAEHDVTPEEFEQVIYNDPGVADTKAFWERFR